jgi:hypothetical protein
MSPGGLMRDSFYSPGSDLQWTYVANTGSAGASL